MDIKKNFGRRIKELRKNRNLSQEKFSEMVDIAQNTLSYIETGDNFCSAETLEKIAKAIDIEPYELFDFGHLKSQDELLNDINVMLKRNPDKMQEVYRVVKAIVN